MLVMEQVSRDTRPSSVYSSIRPQRSGYEPSDTETEWQEKPRRHEKQLLVNRSKTPDPVRTISPSESSQRRNSKIDQTEWQEMPRRREKQLRVNRSKTPNPIRTISLFENNQSRNSNKDPSLKSSVATQAARRHSKSPYKSVRHHDDIHPGILSGPLVVSEHQKHVSPYKARRGEPNRVNDNNDGSFRKRNQPWKYDLAVNKASTEVLRPTNRSSFDHSRSMSAPKFRGTEKQQQDVFGSQVNGAGRNTPQLGQPVIEKGNSSFNARSTQEQEINEQIANMKLSKSSSVNDLLMSTESIAFGDIFCSLGLTDLKEGSQMKNSNHENFLAPEGKVVVVSDKMKGDQQLSKGNVNFNQAPRPISVRNGLSRTNTSSSSALSQLSSGRTSNASSKFSDGSGKLSEGFKKLAVNRQRINMDTWFSCVRKKQCSESKMPVSRAISETSLIEKAFVVEELRFFWADKYRPRSLSGFSCHKQQAQHLKQLISRNECPHVLFKGPSGSGKKALCKALLHEIFGDSSQEVSHHLRHFCIQETQPAQIVVPLTSSPHHVELNLKSESKNARYALMGLVKELTGKNEIIPEASDDSLKPEYKVIVLYEVDKVEENEQHLIKWIMDCYTDICKIMLCCKDDTDLLDAVKSRCKLIKVDPPNTHEIMEVLLKIAKKENFELPVSFAARIATKSKHNMRRAIMALEACKAHNYPFVDGQPIPLGWEEVLVELASEILDDPSPKRLFFTRGKFQKLLVEFVHPKLILQKLVEQFLKGIESGLKRELYYWHAYYNKRLPTGTSALLKLEEFVAKFMSIYRKSSQVPYLE